MHLFPAQMLVTGSVEAQRSVVSVLRHRWKEHKRDAESRSGILIELYNILAANPSGGRTMLRPDTRARSTDTVRRA